MAKKTAIKEKYSKVQIIDEIATSTELTKKQVKQVFEELEGLMGRHLAKRGAGEFSMPGLFKVTTVRKKATKARKGINPFTGEPTVFKAKPARTVVKMRALKKLKDMVL